MFDDAEVLEIEHARHARKQVAAKIELLDSLVEWANKIETKQDLDAAQQAYEILIEMDRSELRDHVKQMRQKQRLQPKEERKSALPKPEPKMEQGAKLDKFFKIVSRPAAKLNQDSTHPLMRDLQMCKTVAGSL